MTSKLAPYLDPILQCFIKTSIENNKTDFSYAVQ